MLMLFQKIVYGCLAPDAPIADVRMVSNLLAKPINKSSSCVLGKDQREFLHFRMFTQGIQCFFDLTFTPSVKISEEILELECRFAHQSKKKISTAIRYINSEFDTLPIFSSE